MSISGLGSVTGVSGTKYDFTNMTNAQAYAAAGKLGDEGKITVLEQSQLQAMAQGVDRMNPANSGTTYFTDNLKSTTPQNFFTNVSNKLASDLRSPDPSGINTTLIATDKALLTALSAYQGTEEFAKVQQTEAGGIISTTA
jgi:hypothetical protein